MPEEIMLDQTLVSDEQAKAPVDLESFLFGDNAKPAVEIGEDETVEEPEDEQAEEAEEENEEEEYDPEETEGPENEDLDGAEAHDGTVPKKVMLAERKKWQKRLEESEKYAKLGRAYADRSDLSQEEIAEHLDEILAKQYAEKNGVPLEDAKREVANQSKELQLKRREAAIELNEEAMSLRNSTTYTLLSDKSVRNEVVQFAADKGLTVKQAYRALYEDSYVAQSNKVKQPTRKVASNTPKPEGTKGGNFKPLSKAEAAIAKANGMSHAEWRKWGRK